MRPVRLRSSLIPSSNCWAALIVALCSFAALCGQSAQAQVVSAGCKTSKQSVVCDQTGFQKVFADAKTASVETQPGNRVAAAEVATMLSRLGKTVSASGGSADVTLVLARLNTEGVMIGPSGTELATLKVYGLGAGGRRGDLIWSETYTGQPDMSWPAVVQGLLRQWQDRIPKS